MKVNIGLLFQTGEEQKLLCPHTQKEKKKPQQESMALNLNFSGFECGALPQVYLQHPHWQFMLNKLMRKLL